MKAVVSELNLLINRIQNTRLLLDSSWELVLLLSFRFDKCELCFKAWFN